MTSGWSALQRQGFALGATRMQDRGAERAAAGLASDVRPALAAGVRAVDELDRAGRWRWVEGLLAHRPVPGDQPADRPARALGLLAAEVPREIGRRWLAASPQPRAGYVPEPQLLALLRALCAATPRKPEAR